MNLARAAALLIAVLALAGPAAAQADRPTPSGLPVPRWVSLKFDKVYARAGPGEDHQLLWVYRVKNLPVQVIQETADWRRVCDPEGGLAWVHKRTTDGRRMVMNLKDSAVRLTADPKENGRVEGLWVGRSLGALDRCKGGWCRIKVEETRGWVREGAAWGLEAAPVCGRR
ncbi:MAG TPA: SH3 domain-containing protein [Caulobacteraceae bacterium]|jgi:SH3-like domain-containing protein